MSATLNIVQAEVRFISTVKPYQLTWDVVPGFKADRTSPISGVQAAPMGQRTLLNRGPRCSPPAARGCCTVGATGTPEIGISGRTRDNLYGIHDRVLDFSFGGRTGKCRDMALY